VAIKPEKTKNARERGRLEKARTENQ